MNYSMLADAIDFYECSGFKYLEVPWAVGKDAFAITSPPECTVFPLEDKSLVASAEQSLLELALAGKLEKDTAYVACTPCFRDDPSDAIHHRYFMKVELMIYEPKDPQAALDRLVNTAMDFFRGYTDARTEYLAVNGGFPLIDIVSQEGIELGSYGVREHASVGRWVFGTGLAEPRLSFVCERGRK